MDLDSRCMSVLLKGLFVRARIRRSPGSRKEKIYRVEKMVV